jgi:hypothetical protein
MGLEIVMVKGLRLSKIKTEGMVVKLRVKGEMDFGKEKKPIMPAISTICLSSMKTKQNTEKLASCKGSRPTQTSLSLSSSVRNQVR